LPSPPLIPSPTLLRSRKLAFLAACTQNPDCLAVKDIPGFVPAGSASHHGAGAGRVVESAGGRQRKVRRISLSAVSSTRSSRVHTDRKSTRLNSSHVSI